MQSDAENSRSLAAIIADMKVELREFTETRLELLKTELQEKTKALKLAAPLAGLAGLFLVTAYLLFTAAAVGLIAAFFRGNPYRWFFASGITAVLWAVLGGIAAYFVAREFKLKRLVPTKTMEVLKGDKMWIRSEAKNRL
jgi:uncharacterized membrane protein YqjE